MTISVVEVRQSVAAEVRAMLARKRISTREAARRMGVSQWWLQRRVTGEIPFDVGEITAVADLLDTPVETFFAGTAELNAGRGIRKRWFRSRRRDQDIRAVAA
jgi:transcriptional regulator with XRE-family HTH domain